MQSHPQRSLRREAGSTTPPYALTPMRALALEHHHSNPVGIYGDVLLGRGIEVHRVRLDLGEALPDWREYDLLVVMGGAMSVYEEDAYPWLVAEKRAIREAVTTGCPYFGVCLGSQLLASALGSRVFRGPEPELGVNPIFLCEAARRDPVFRAFPLDVEVFEFHSDTFALPEGAVRLARSPATKTRRSMSGGPRTGSNAIWSPRSTTPVTGSPARSGRRSKPATDVAL